jgi:hypothetical protein
MKRDTERTGTIRRKIEERLWEERREWKWICEPKTRRNGNVHDNGYY